MSAEIELSNFSVFPCQEYTFHDKRTKEQKLDDMFAPLRYHHEHRFESEDCRLTWKKVTLEKYEGLGAQMDKDYLQRRDEWDAKWDKAIKFETAIEHCL